MFRLSEVFTEETDIFIFSISCYVIQRKSAVLLVFCNNGKSYKLYILNLCRYPNGFCIRKLDIYWSILNFKHLEWNHPYKWSCKQADMQLYLKQDYIPHTNVYSMNWIHFFQSLWFLFCFVLFYNNIAVAPNENEGKHTIFWKILLPAKYIFSCLLWFLKDSKLSAGGIKKLAFLLEVALSPSSVFCLVKYISFEHKYTDLNKWCTV